jgi:antitoxin ParD1/3/4
MILYDCEVAMSSTIERLTITLTAEIAHAVKGAVSSGEYASSSEIIREALRDWRHKRAVQERLQADVRAGIEDIEAGRVQDFDADRIIEKGRKKLNARSSSA